MSTNCTPSSLRWRHNGGDSVSNHQPSECLLNRLIMCRSKKTSKLRVAGLCVGYSPGTDEFPAQMASNAGNVSIWWRHHDTLWYSDANMCQWTRQALFQLMVCRLFGYEPLSGVINTPEVIITIHGDAGCEYEAQRQVQGWCIGHNSWHVPLIPAFENIIWKYRSFCSVSSSVYSNRRV